MASFWDIVGETRSTKTADALKIWRRDIEQFYRRVAVTLPIRRAMQSEQSSSSSTMIPVVQSGDESYVRSSRSRSRRQR